MLSRVGLLFLSQITSPHPGNPFNALCRESGLAKRMLILLAGTGFHLKPTCHSKRSAYMTELLPIRLHMYVLQKILLTTVRLQFCSIPFDDFIMFYFI